jgi:3-oxoacyl-[acyl-carrier-protein] synthase III
MNLKFRGKKIIGMLSVLPANERNFVDDMKNFDFPESRSLKMKLVMGYDRHRIVTDGTCVSDLAVAGLEYLFQRNLLAPDGFDAMILVGQSPDHFIPPTSNVIQGRLNLRRDLFCLDICQGCAGFLIGLIQAFMMLDQESIQRVVLINGDVLSRKVCVKDRNSYPLIGDALSITVLERDPEGLPIFANLKMDGTARDALMIPAGGFRMPSTPETSVPQDVGDNNYRSLNDLRMDGVGVFNFVQTEVPPMIDDLLAFAAVPRETIDYFLFHQPNRFMLQKLADKMGVGYERMPNNIVENFGNASGVTIPTVITFNLGQKLLETSYTVCLAGFGVGLTWSSMVLKLGGLKFCEMIDF